MAWWEDVNDVDGERKKVRYEVRNQCLASTIDADKEYEGWKVEKDAHGDAEPSLGSIVPRT